MTFCQPVVSRSDRVGWKFRERLDFKIVEIDRHQHVVVGDKREGQVEVDADLKHAERCSRGHIDQRPARTVPPTAIQAGPLSCQIGKRLSAEAPSKLRASNTAQAAKPWEIRPSRTSTSRMP